MVQLSHLYITTGKTIPLTIQTYVSKVISLLTMHYFFKTPPNEQKNKKSSVAMLSYSLTRRLTSHRGLLVSDPVRTQKWDWMFAYPLTPWRGNPSILLSQTSLQAAAVDNTPGTDFCRSLAPEDPMLWQGGELSEVGTTLQMGRCRQRLSWDIPLDTWPD